MGKDSIRLLAAIKKRLNFQTQRDRKIQGKINSNSLGNRCSIRLSYGTCVDHQVAREQGGSVLAYPIPIPTGSGGSGCSSY
jgi:hypothetical protein